MRRRGSRPRGKSVRHCWRVGDRHLPSSLVTARRVLRASEVEPDFGFGEWWRRRESKPPGHLPVTTQNHIGFGAVPRKDSNSSVPRVFSTTPCLRQSYLVLERSWRRSWGCAICSGGLGTQSLDRGDWITADVTIWRDLRLRRMRYPLGHSAPTITARYDRLGDDALISAAARLSFPYSSRK